MSNGTGFEGKQRLSFAIESFPEGSFVPYNFTSLLQGMPEWVRNIFCSLKIKKFFLPRG